MLDSDNFAWLTKRLRALTHGGSKQKSLQEAPSPQHRLILEYLDSLTLEPEAQPAFCPGPEAVEVARQRYAHLRPPEPDPEFVTALWGKLSAELSSPATATVGRAVKALDAVGNLNGSMRNGTRAAAPVLRMITRPRHRLVVGATAIVVLILAFGWAFIVQPAGNVWAVGNLVGQCKDTQIRTGPGSAYYVHTIVPEDNWTVKVIDGPRIVQGQVWWDTSRREAGDVSGGTGWVLQAQADNCPGSGPGVYPAYGTLLNEPWIEVIPGGTAYNSPYGPAGFSKDPVQTFTGSYTYERTDLAIPGRGPALHFTRVYNSNDTRVGPLGQGWTHNYNVRLVNPGDGTGSVVLVAPQGRSIYYTNNNGTFTPPQDVYISLVKNADGTYTATHKDQTVWTFNVRGQLTRITDRYGNHSDLQYDSTTALLTSISDPGNRGSLSLQYDPQTFRLLSITDWAGREVSFDYDLNGRRLSSVTDRENNTTSYEYEGATHLLTSIIDGNGHVAVSNTYDAQGRVISQKDARGLTTGQASAFQYNPGAGGSMVTTITYPVTSADPDWHLVEEDTYDGEGRLIKRISKPSSQASEWVTEEYGYDSRSNRTSVKDGRGNTTQFCYDVSIAGAPVAGGQGNLTRLIEPPPVAGGNRLVTLLDYDSKNNLTRNLPPKGVNSGTNVTCSTDLSGVVDSRYATEMTYDDQKIKLVAITTRYTEPGSGLRTATSKLEYNDPANPGMLTRSISPLGNTGPTPNPAYATNMVYYPDGMLKESIDPTGAKTTYTYDAIGRLTSMVDANGNAAGGSPAQHTWQYTYDNEDRMLTTSAPAPSTGGAPLVTKVTYDKVGNRLMVTDGNGQVTRYEYDERDALKEVRESPNAWTDPNATPAELIVTEYQHDHLGNLTRIVRAKGDTANERATDYTYDGLNRVRTETQHPNWPSTSGALVSDYTYDQNGNRVTAKDPLGQVTAMRYDNLNRLTQILYSDGGRTPNVVYTYDANDNRTTMVDGTGVTVYAYDEMDRLLSVTTPGDKKQQTRTVAYRYDLNSNQTSLAYTDGSILSYDYDGADRLTSLKDWLGNITSYEYFPAGDLKTTNNPNGTVSQYTYDNAGRLTEVWHRLGMNTISRHKYTMDAVGNRTRLDEVLPQNGVVKPEDPKRQLTTRYEYDRLYRLTAELAPDLNVRYGYDPAGNRLSMTRNGVLTNYAYDRADRITGAGGVAYVVDANGNLRERGKERYEYDQANRLINSRVPAPTQYIYDGDGKRYKTDAGQGPLDVRVYDVNGPLPLLLEDGRRKFIWGLGLAYALEGNGTMEVYHADGLGSVRAVSYKNGNVTQNYRYDAFGVLVGPPTPQGSHNQPFQFAGEERDKETGFMYLRARYYDPSIGRFIQRDSFPGIAAVPQTLNRYTYVENNPASAVDPSGHVSSRILRGFYGSGSSSYSTWLYNLGQFFQNIEPWLSLPGSPLVGVSGYVRSNGTAVGAYARTVPGGSAFKALGTAATLLSVGLAPVLQWQEDAGRTDLTTDARLARSSLSLSAAALGAAGAIAITGVAATVGLPVLAVAAVGVGTAYGANLLYDKVLKEPLFRWAGID